MSSLSQELIADLDKYRHKNVYVLYRYLLMHKRVLAISHDFEKIVDLAYDFYISCSLITLYNRQIILRFCEG